MSMTLVDLGRNIQSRAGTACLVQSFMSFSVYFQSMLSLSLIAFHRYIMISKNAYYESIFSNVKLVMMILSLWLLSFSVGTPLLTGLIKVGYSVDRFHCMVDWRLNNRSAILLMACYLIPLSILIFSYYNVIKTTKLAEKSLNLRQNRQHNYKKVTPRKKMNRMLMLVVSLFFLAFSPYFSVTIGECIFRTRTHPVHSFVSTAFAYSSSLFDFVIYYRMSTVFRKATITLLKCKYKKQNTVNNITLNIKIADKS